MSVKYKISGRGFHISIPRYYYSTPLLLFPIIIRHYYYYSPPTIFRQFRKIYVYDKPVYEKFIGSNTNSPIKSAVFYRIFLLFKQRLRYDKLNARA